MRWQPVSVDSVIVADRARPISPEHVASLRGSFQRLGGQLQLQPVVLDEQLRLIDGAHRLEAARQEGWSSISAVIVPSSFERQPAVLEAEANLLRRSLGPAEAEAAWREHYEPALREQALRRRHSGLKQNEGASAPEFQSLAKAAKAITGLSIDTLQKIAEIRQIAASGDLPANVVEAAARALQRLTLPDARVEPIYRRLRALRREATQSQADMGREETLAAQSRLTRALEEVSRLDEDLAGPLVSQLEKLVREDPSNRMLLGALRDSLARSLAITVAIECRLQPNPMRALRDLSREVGQLLAATSRAGLAAVGQGVMHASRGTLHGAATAG